MEGTPWGGQAGRGDSESERKSRERPASLGSAGEAGGDGGPSARANTVLCKGLRWAVWAQPSPEGRVIPVGPSRAERGRGDPGQGPALGLLAGRGISQGSQTPRVHSAPIEVHLGETGVWGRLTLLGAGHLGQTERWKRCTNEKMPALWFPHGLQSWGLEEPWGGRASSHDVPSPPPNNITSEYKVSSL